MGIEDIRDALVIRERSTFLLTDPDGNVPAGNTKGFGIYHADTRHLSAYSLTLNGMRPVRLLSTAELGYAMEQVMTNPTMNQDGGRTILRGSIELRRQRVIGDVLEETLRITNYNPFPVTLNLLYEFDADFADIFDVRGYKRERFGRMHDPVVSERAIEYAYSGIDGRDRRTRVVFDRKPDYLDASTALFRMTLPPRETSMVHIEIQLHETGDPDIRRIHRIDSVANEYEAWMESCTQISTDNVFLNRVLTRSLQDVRMLWSETHEGDIYPAAGTPWFDALFGRDSCILSMQMLAYRPSIAKACLHLLAKWQGNRVDHARDEEPGKILHELRFDELSSSGELPYSPYYGSIDSTPLFLLLAAEYYAWTADDDTLRELMPALRQAIAWMDEYGDPERSGFLSYEKRSAKGLLNQGWKDSWDAVVHRDGTLARAPVSLCEVQGYAYGARARLADAFDRIGERKLAMQLRRDAKELRKRFNDAYWVDDIGYYAMALDGEGAQVAPFSSNPGHCLWTGIIDERRAAATVDHLMSPKLNSGWGIRTLSTANPRFNPIGYHVGTVWPHDNSLIAMGLKKYGFAEELNSLTSAIFDAAVSFEYFRLPELFGGDTRTAYGPPVPYPVACRPQSWAAGAMPLIMQAILGLHAEAPDGQLRIVDPELPYWLHSVSVRNLRIGEGTVSLNYRRDRDQTLVEVQEATGGIDVVVSQRWPGMGG